MVFASIQKAAALGVPGFSGMVLISAGEFTMGDNLDGDTDAIPNSMKACQGFTWMWIW